MDDFKFANKKRIYNLIWDTSEDYSFTPIFIGNDIGSNPSFYFNMVIGLSYKYFGKENLEDLFKVWENTKYQERYDSLSWLGLENYVFNKESLKRKNLSYLRDDYARDFFDDKNDLNRRNLSYKDIKVYMLMSKHMANISGINFTGLRKSEEDLLKDLYKINDKKSLKEQFYIIFSKYFDFKEDLKSHKSKFSLFINHFDYKSPHSFERSIKPSTFKLDYDINKFKNPISFYKFKRKEKKKEEIEDLFGKSIFDDNKLNILQNLICKDEDRHENLWFTRGLKEDIKNKEVIKEINNKIETNNKKYFSKKSLYDLEIKKLSNKFKKLNNDYSFDSSYISKSGRVDPTLSYRAYINKENIFKRKDYRKKSKISVDLLIDSSASMIGKEDDIAISAYILSRSLELSDINIRIITYLSYDYYNIISVIKDFDESTNKDKIFSFLARGFNRDSTLLKAYRALDKKVNNRISILISDLNPSDLRPIYRKGIKRNISYDGDKAFDLVKKEMNNLRFNNYKLNLLSFNSKDDEKFIKRAKDMFFSDFYLLDSPTMLASRASVLISRNIKKFKRKGS